VLLWSLGISFLSRKYHYWMIRIWLEMEINTSQKKKKKNHFFSHLTHFETGSFSMIFFFLSILFVEIIVIF